MSSPWFLSSFEAGQLWLAAGLAPVEAPPPPSSSGAWLLVEAYALVWLLVFAFVWLSARRLGRLEARICELEQQLERAGEAERHREDAARDSEDEQP